MSNSGYDSLPDRETPDEKQKINNSTRDLNGSYILACRGEESLENSEADVQSQIGTNQTKLHRDFTIYTSVALDESEDDENTDSKPIRHCTRVIHDNSADKSLPNPANISSDKFKLLCNTIADLTILPNPDSTRDAPLCRICHEGDENEDLLSPCFCSGTVGALHMSCLEQWLGTSDKTRCEICEFQFSIAKKPKPMTWFLRNKALGQERRYMIADIGCAVCFTPFTIGSVTGCLVGAQYFTSVNKDWQATTLILLAMTNLLIFLLWCWFTARRNYILCSTWRENFQEIKIKYNPPDKNNKIRYNADKNNNTQTINRGTSVTERTLIESSFPGKIISPNKHKSRKVSYEQSPGINQSKVHVEEAENSTLKPGTPYPKRKHSSTCDKNIIHPENHIEMIQIEEETKVLTDQDKQRLRQMQLYKIGNTSTSTPTISSVIMKKHTIFDETHCCATPIQYPWGTPVVVNDHPDHPGMFVQTPYTLVKSNMAASSMAKRGLMFQKSPKAAIQNNFEIPVEKGLDKD